MTGHTPTTVQVEDPFDAHLHTRQGNLLKAVAPITEQQMAVAIAMPNTKPPLTTYDGVLEYLHALRAVAPDCYWLGTCYLTQHIDPHEVERLWEEGCIAGVKYYPPHGTTNSQDGVPPEWLFEKTSPVAEQLAMMKRRGIPLQIHGEVVVFRGEEIDPYGRECLFFNEMLPRILEEYPELKISVEHISSAVAARFMRAHGNPDRLVCTVTAHHPLVTRTDQFRGGANAHLHCLPMVKTAEDRLALMSLLAEGHPYVMMGTDSAPHPLENKHGPVAFGGMFTAPCALELYAEIFDSLGALDKLQAFASDNAHYFYHDAIDPRDRRKVITLEKGAPWQSSPVSVGDTEIWPFGYSNNATACHTFPWSVSSTTLLD